MWIPDQRLTERTIKSLLEGGFSYVQVEFLGWLNYYANALNNSRNPVKAAHTILASPKAEKMIKVFVEKKKESTTPKVHAEHDEISRKFRDLEKWIQQAQNTEPYFDS